MKMLASDKEVTKKSQPNPDSVVLPVRIVKFLSNSENIDRFIDIELRYISLQENVRFKVERNAEFDGLKSSIQENGLIQNPTVAYVDGKIKLLTGRRRFEACKELGWSKMTFKVQRIQNDQERVSIQLAENINRSSLNSIEYIESVAQLKALTRKSNTQIGESLGKSRVFIDVLIRASKWPDKIKKQIGENEIKITKILEIATSRGSTDPEVVERKINFLIAGKNGAKSTKISAHKSKQEKLAAWFNDNSAQEYEVQLIKKFIRDMKLKGWIAEDE